MPSSFSNHIRLNVMNEKRDHESQHSHTASSADCANEADLAEIGHRERQQNDANWRGQVKRALAEWTWGCRTYFHAVRPMTSLQCKGLFVCFCDEPSACLTDTVFWLLECLRLQPLVNASVASACIPVRSSQTTDGVNPVYSCHPAPPCSPSLQ